VHNIIPVTIFFGLIAFSGWSVLSALDMRERMSPAQALALSYGIGMGAVSLEVFFIFLFGAKATLLKLFFPWVSLSVFNMAKRRLYVPATGKMKKEKMTGLEKFLLCGISCEVIYAFFRAIIFPMESYDAVAIWAIKAKAIFLAGGLPVGFFTNMNYIESHLDYPLLVPLGEAVFYFIAGGIRDALVKCIFPSYFAAFVVLFYFVLTRFLDRRKSLLCTFLLGTIPQFKEFATNGYADFVVSFYYTMGFLFLYLWFVEGKREYLLVAGLFSAMCAWTKNEGYSLCILNLLVALAMVFLKTARGDRQQLFDATIGISFYIVAVVMCVFPWEAFKASLGIKSDLLARETFSLVRAFKNISRLPMIAYEYQKQFFGFKKWNLIWVLFLVTFIVNLKRSFSGRMLFITISILAALGTYTVVYIVTPKNFGWHLSTTASRLFIHIVPLAVFWLAMMLKELKVDL